MKRNSGLAFVVFKSKQISMRFRLDLYFKEKIKRTSTLYEVHHKMGFDFHTIKAQSPYLQSDLKWENVSKDPFIA
jgi:hypothetical protein